MDLRDAKVKDTGEAFMIPPKKQGNGFWVVLGWIFIPFIMIFIKWKSLSVVGRVIGVIWAVFAFSSLLGNIRKNEDISSSIQQQKAAPVVVVQSESKTAEAKTNQEAKAQAEAEAKAKKEAEAKAKAEAEAKAKEEAKAEAINKAPHIGESATVGNLNVAIYKGPLTGPTVGNFIQHKAKGMYWLIRVGVENKDKESRTIDASMFQLIGPDGIKYDPDSTANIYANDDTHFFLEKINPGISIEGFVVFDMPQNITDTDDFILRVNSGVGLKATSHVDFVLKKR